MGLYNSSNVETVANCVLRILIQASLHPFDASTIWIDVSKHSKAGIEGAHLFESLICILVIIKQHRDFGGVTLTFELAELAVDGVHNGDGVEGTLTGL